MKQIVILALIVSTALGALAQGTTFTYQGRLNNGSSAATGSYDFRFRLASDALGNTYVGSPVLTNALPVSNGLFVATLDFGSAFNGSNYWLQVDVKTNGAVSYTTLTPLQSITPTPYAITARGLAGSLPAAQLSGAIANANLPASPTVSGTLTATAFAGNGAAVTNVDAATLNGQAATNFWQLGGNAGTTSNSFIGTSDSQPVNFRVAYIQALRLMPPDFPNFGSVSIIGGSRANYIDFTSGGSVIGGGGFQNYFYPTPVNDISNSIAANSEFSVIGGGLDNHLGVFVSYSFLGGGQANSIADGSGDSVIGGGFSNRIGAAGGYAFLGGGFSNTISSNAITSVLVGGLQGTVGSQGTYAFLGGGYGNRVEASSSVLVGGQNNFIGLDANYAALVGGSQNTNLASTSSFIGAGFNNLITGSGYANISGGSGNVIRYASSANINGGSANAIIAADESTIGAGSYNLIQSNAQDSAIISGYSNTVRSGSYESFIGGGRMNTVAASVAGAVIGGGNSNQVVNIYGTIGGGAYNIAGGAASTIPGGWSNQASGIYSMAAGNRAKAVHGGAYVWADSSNADFSSTGANQYLIRAAGGVGINTNNPGANALAVAGNVLATSFTGNGAGLNNLTPANFASGTANISITGTAANVSGIVAIANGGTGAGNAATARTNLGLGTLATVSPTGTASASTYLRGDNSWAAVSGGATTQYALRTNAITLTNSTMATILAVSLEANKVYELNGNVLGARVGATSSTGNFRVTYSGAATTDFGLLTSGNWVNDTVIDATASFDLEALGQPASFTATPSTRYSLSGYLRTTSAGTLTILGARTTTNTTVDLSVREGSYLIARPLF